MTHQRLQDATRIVRNTIGLFLVSALAKGAGLIVVIIVARYLGAEALGIYVVILALNVVLTTLSPMGTSEAAIRAVSRDHSAMLRYWVESAAVSALFAVLFGLLLAGASRLLGLPAETQAAVDIAAVALVPGGLMVASQAPLQAIERMKYLTISAFIGRLVSLTALIVMLESGAGIAATFVSHLMFMTVTAIILAIVIIRHGRAAGATTDWNLAPARIMKTIVGSLPFAGQRLLAEAAVRSTLIILPLLVSMQSVGLFDAGDRIRRTIAIVIPTTMLAVMPEFSRVFKSDKKQATALAGYTLKFLLIVMLPLVLVLVAAAPAIIELLYGAGYGHSVLVLRIGAWSLLFSAADMVLKQIMIASHEEHAMLWRSWWGVVVQVASTVLLAELFGITGAALSVLLASAFIFLLDAQFVRRHMARMDLKNVAVKPLLCAATAGAMVLLLDGQNLMIVLAASGVAYVAALALFRAITAAELAILRQLPANLLRKG